MDGTAGGTVGGMTSSLTLDDVIAWADANPNADARIESGGSYHTGVLHVTRLSDGRVTLRVRDSRRNRGQYAAVFQRHIDAGRFQVKVDARYRPIADILAP